MSQQETALPSAVKSTQEVIESKGVSIVNKIGTQVVEGLNEPLVVVGQQSPEKTSAASVRRYPNNLDTEEQPHSVNFFISTYVPGASAAKITEGNALSDSFGIASSRSGNGITYENAQNVDQISSIGASLTGAVAGGALGKELAGGLSNLTGIGGIVGGILKAGGQVGGAVAGAKGVKEFITKNASSLKSAPAIRIKDVISLHIPQSPQAKYGANYENESIGTLLGALATSEGVGVIDAFQKQASQGNIQELIARGLVDAATIPKELGLGNLNFGGLARAASKKVRNPYQEQIFKTMNFRSFAFQYKFAPRNKEELQQVMEIIDLFKYHMHPEKANDGAFFVFPSVFDIEYRYKGERNGYVNRIATSVLTDLSVDYGSEGVFTTFRGLSGAPSEVTIAMQFREIALLTKGPNGQLTDGSRTGF